MIFAWILLCSLAGTHVTYQLQHRTSLGAIRASALPTVVFVALAGLMPFPLPPALQSAFFGATFVGMSDRNRLGEKPVLAASGVFSGIFALLTQLHWGLGGALGAAAFAACLLVYGLGRYLERY